MTSCLECGDREQSGQFGLCDRCRSERRDRVRAVIQGGDVDELEAVVEVDEDDQESGGQLSLADF